MRKFNKLIRRIEFKTIINIILLFSIILTAISSYKEILEEFTLTGIEDALIVVLLASLVLTIIRCIPSIFLYLIFRLAVKKADKDKLDETDFEKNKSYYREIIKNYSVGTLNYIDDFQLDYKRAYVAKLLELEKNGIIKVKGKRITIIKNPTSKIDKAFLDSIKDNKVTLSLYEYERLCIEEAMDAGLIEKSTHDRRIIYAIILFAAPQIYTALLFASTFLFFSIMTSEKILFIYIGFILIASIIFTSLFIFSFAYLIKASKNPKKYERTEKGKKINIALEGLKLFMKDFGEMHNKSSEDITLWEDYLLYAVMFNQNKRVVDEYSIFIDYSL